MLIPDLQMARDHLELIGTHQHGSDGTFVFVLLDDKRKTHTKKVTATLDEALPKLISLQAQGFGVFVIPQFTRGRGLAHILRVRSLAFDLDDARPVDALAALPILPSAILKTPRGWHVYFECDEKDPTWAEIKDVSALHKALGHQIGADKGALNLAQPMRLAGFYHLKGVPTMIEIESLNYGSARSFAELAARIPHELVVESPLVPLNSGVTYPFPILRHVLRDCSRRIREAKHGTRFNTIRSCAYRLGCYVPFGLDMNVARTWILRAVAEHADPELTREVERRLSTIFEAGREEGLSRPPTPPPTVRDRFEREKWAADLVERMQWDGVVIGEALRRHRSWKSHSTYKQAEYALGKALRAWGYSDSVIREGRPKRKFIRSVPLGKDNNGRLVTRSAVNMPSDELILPPLG